MTPFGAPVDRPWSVRGTLRERRPRSERRCAEEELAAGTENRQG
jgi:hypothetical protein